MTDLWLHVNTFFIIVLIFFRYGSHIKKYMTVYFVCLFDRRDKKKRRDCINSPSA